MPGSSLWLVAPGTSPSPFPSDPDHSGPAGTLPARLQSLIAANLPAAYPGLCHPVPFVPHVTLTSGIDPARYAAAGAQAWLDALPFPPATTPRVRFGPLRTADAFVRRATVAVARGGLAPLARAARRTAVEDGDVGKTEAWLKTWEPHVSLVYGSKPIDESTLEQMAQTVQEAGVRLGNLGDLGGGKGDDSDPVCPVPENGGWEGGEIWLVPTYEEIGKWRPIASRVL